jgi:capsular polysaccharide biosynthesis protein
MTLTTVWKILRRRWWLMLLPLLVALLYSGISYQAPGTTYNSGVRFIVGQPPGTETRTSDEQRYFNWLASEYIVNGLTDWVRGNNFATAVSQELTRQGIDIPSYEISIVPDNTRSMLTISINHPDPVRLEAIMSASITVLTEQNSQALPQLGGDTAVLIPLDTPSVNPIPTGLTNQLQLPLRLLIALAFGIGLGLVVEYLDGRVHGRDELTDLNLPLLGEIPKE